MAATWPGPQPRLQYLGRRDGSAGALQRVGEALGDLVACRFGARQLAQQRDAFLLRFLVGGLPRTGQDRERGVDEAPTPRRVALELQGVVVCPQRGGIVAGGRQRARPAGDRGHGLRRETHDLVERGDRRLRLTERRQQVRVRGERRVRGAIARGRRALGPCAKTIAQPRPTGGARELDQAPRELVVVRAFEQRALGAFEQRGRIGAANLPVRARRQRYGEGHEQGRNERQTPHTRKIAPPEPPSLARTGP